MFQYFNMKTNVFPLLQKMHLGYTIIGHSQQRTEMIFDAQHCIQADGGFTVVYGVT